MHPTGSQQFEQRDRRCLFLAAPVCAAPLCAAPVSAAPVWTATVRAWPIVMVLLAWLLFAPLTGLRADEPDLVGWPLETLQLKTKKKLRGVAVASDKKGLEFAEVARPPGKPMFVVIRRIARDEIQDWQDRLETKDRQKSLMQLAKFRNRLRIEQGDREQVELTTSEFDGFPCLRFQNAWFTLWCNADEETTRRCIVQVDQMFRAYRQIFPPRDNARPLRILLLGSLEDYGDYLRRQGLNVQNPAFYSQQQNLIVAGLEVGDFGARLAELRERHSQRIEELERLDKAFLEQFNQLRSELVAAGFKPAEITQEKNARLRGWKEERDRKLKQITAANRRNDAKFQQLTQRMFKRLYHEAFHAYLENRVYPSREYDVPRWLNEGLAQVFESGRLEAGLLRIDAPDPTLLRRLQNDLKNRPRLTIADLAQTEPQDFVGSHENPQADRFYLHAWAVAYYLTFISPRTPAQIDAFVRAEKKAPLERLESFVGTTPSELDARWRLAMQKISAAN